MRGSTLLLVALGFLSGFLLGAREYLILRNA